MSIEESDPLGGYGIWSAPDDGAQDIIKSIYADYDPSDPYGDFDKDRPFELMHELRDTAGQSRRISKFSNLDEAIVAGQILTLLLPKEYVEDDNWHHFPLLVVWQRNSKCWDKTYSCQDRFGLASAMVEGLKRTNAEFRTIEEEFNEYQNRHMFCDVARKKPKGSGR